jgi:hypothetical protein
MGKKFNALFAQQKQAEREVAVKRDMAFPIGIFCAMLLEKHKLFCDILLGKLIKRCPYIVPMYIKKGVRFLMRDFCVWLMFNKTLIDIYG